jgi:hypothetical protein
MWSATRRGSKWRLSTRARLLDIVHFRPVPEREKCIIKICYQNYCCCCCCH